MSLTGADRLTMYGTVPGTEGTMRRGVTLVAVLAVLGTGQGCATTEEFQKGRSLNPEYVRLIHEGMPKADVFKLVGPPSATVFVEPTPEDRARQVRVKEVMSYHFSKTQKVTQAPILGGDVTETGPLQELEIGLENGVVTYHDSTEGAR